VAAVLAVGLLWFLRRRKLRLRQEARARADAEAARVSPSGSSGSSGDKGHLLNGGGTPLVRHSLLLEDKVNASLNL